MVLVVVLCTTDNWYALVERLKFVQSFFLQYKDAKKSTKIDAYKWGHVSSIVPPLKGYNKDMWVLEVG